jgi:hypothetical protein
MVAFVEMEKMGNYTIYSLPYLPDFDIRLFLEFLFFL